jgi:DNA transposition AAA+ family ATPase
MIKKLKTVGGPPPWDEDLRCWLQAYIDKYPHHTTGILSRSQFIGVSKTVLDEYIAGIYFLPIESGGKGINPETSKVEHAIRAYRERIEGSVRHGYTNSFVETRTWFQLQHACNVAINENVLVVAYGKPGVGKSRCLLEFTVRRMTAAPVTILCSRNITPKYFVEKLAQDLGLNNKSRISQTEDSIAEKLNRYPRPIFVDQANYLSEKSLGSICYIWEKARIPIVLIGTKDLFELFMTSSRTEDVRAQISSRVAMHYLLSELSLTEVKAIIKKALGDDATDDAVAQIFNVTGGIHRHVDMIVPRIFELREVNKKKLSDGKLSRTEKVL